MYLLVGTLTILLLYQRPLALSAKAIPDDAAEQKRAFSMATFFDNFAQKWQITSGRQLSELLLFKLDDRYEDRVIEDLVRQVESRGLAGDQTQEGDDLEIDLAPPEEFLNPEDTEGTKENPQEPKKRDSDLDEEKDSKKRKIEDVGELEFATFKDPKPRQNLRTEDIPVVEVKRAPAGSNVFGGIGAVTADLGNTMFVATITACVVAAVFGLVVAGVVFRKIHKQHEAAREASYPQYGGTGPAIEKKTKKSPTASGDASLAYSAQLHHFNQTKQKIISTETPHEEARGQESDDSEGEGEEGDYSVYECPGLAPTGDIEVSNPLFENTSPKSKDAPENLSSSSKADGD